MDGGWRRGPDDDGGGGDGGPAWDDHLPADLTLGEARWLWAGAFLLAHGPCAPLKADPDIRERVEAARRRLWPNDGDA